MDNSVCKKHSGITVQIEKLEANVTQLWKKWDGMQKLVIGIFVTLALNLLGVIGILISME